MRTLEFLTFVDAHGRLGYIKGKKRIELYFSKMNTRLYNNHIILVFKYSFSRCFRTHIYRSAFKNLYVLSIWFVERTKILYFIRLLDMHGDFLYRHPLIILCVLSYVNSISIYLFFLFFNRCRNYLRFVLTQFSNVSLIS